MPTLPPMPPRNTVRFALPPSLGRQVASDRAARLQEVLTSRMGKPVEVYVASDYEALSKDLLAGRSDAAWAPPFVCARVEAMGVRILVRGVRGSGSTYRAALVCREDSPFISGELAGARALWVDRDSVGGCLLACGYLRGKGLNPSRLFSKQEFAGSYRAAVEGVLDRRADVTSVFAPSVGMGGSDTTGLSQIAPGRERELRVLAFTEESPNDGVAVSMNASPDLVEHLESILLSLHESTEGQTLLREIFSAQSFEQAPRMGYRALYRVALASL